MGWSYEYIVYTYPHSYYLLHAKHTQFFCFVLFFSFTSHSTTHYTNRVRVCIYVCSYTYTFATIELRLHKAIYLFAFSICICISLFYYNNFSLLLLFISFVYALLIFVFTRLILFILAINENVWQRFACHGNATTPIYYNLQFIWFRFPVFFPSPSLRNERNIGFHTAFLWERVNVSSFLVSLLTNGHEIQHNQ